MIKWNRLRVREAIVLRKEGRKEGMYVQSNSPPGGIRGMPGAEGRPLINELSPLNTK